MERSYFTVDALIKRKHLDGRDWLDCSAHSQMLFREFESHRGRKQKHETAIDHPTTVAIEHGLVMPVRQLPQAAGKPCMNV